MKIVINIEADSPEEVRAAIASLQGQHSVEVHTTTYAFNQDALNRWKPQEAGAEAEAQVKEEEKSEPVKKTRKKAEVAPIAEPIAAPSADPLATTAPVTADPLASAPVTTSSDPLASAPVTTSSDPLASAPVTTSADPLASTPATSPTDLAPLSGVPVTGPALSDIRDAIGKLTDNKEGVKAILARYQSSNNTPVTKPGELQEKDYADVLDALNLIS